MTRILTQYYPDQEANDNAIIMAPMWDGLKFMGYSVVKGNWKRPDNGEAWVV